MDTVERNEKGPTLSDINIGARRLVDPNLVGRVNTRHSSKVIPKALELI
jgi:hypothetical protein